MTCVNDLLHVVTYTVALVFVYRKRSKRILKYSQTLHKRPLNMSSGGGHLREVVAYESLDHY